MRALALALVLVACRSENLPDDPRPGASADPIPAAAISARIDFSAASFRPAPSPVPTTFTGPSGVVPYPILRDDPPALSSPGLPPEVVRRILRQNFGRFRLCYQAAAASDPTLAGTVSVRFVIESDGAVGAVMDAGSTLGDTDAVECVERGIQHLAFPMPSAGALTVTETLYFTPRPEP